MPTNLTFEKLPTNLRYCALTDYHIGNIWYDRTGQLYHFVTKKDGQNVAIISPSMVPTIMVDGVAFGYAGRYGNYSVWQSSVHSIYTPMASNPVMISRSYFTGYIPTIYDDFWEVGAGNGYISNSMASLFSSVAVTPKGIATGTTKTLTVWWPRWEQARGASTNSTPSGTYTPADGATGTISIGSTTGTPLYHVEAEAFRWTR